MNCIQDRADLRDTKPLAVVNPKLFIGLFDNVCERVFTSAVLLVNECWNDVGVDGVRIIFGAKGEVAL